jgi:hypothetical protein
MLFAMKAGADPNVMKELALKTVMETEDALMEAVFAISVSKENTVNSALVKMIVLETENARTDYAYVKKDLEE